MLGDALFKCFLVYCFIPCVFVKADGLSINAAKHAASPFRMKRETPSSNGSVITASNGCLYDSKTFVDGSIVRATDCEICECILGIVSCKSLSSCDESKNTQTTVNNYQLPTTENYKGCTLPDHPDHGKWTILGAAPGALPKTNVELSTVLTFSCDAQYKLSTNFSFVACLNEGWNAPIPYCLKLCPPLHNTDIITVTCADENFNEINCTKATEDATAKFECSSFYESTDRTNALRYCFDGKWTSPPPQCVPVCGEKRVTADTLIINGKNVTSGDYPWVTAVYQNQNGKIVNICGGSMLSQKVIVTAAHCLTDDYGNRIDKSFFHIAVGKYYNAYMDPKDTLAQYSDIQKIFVHPKYKGFNQQHASDIALLITKDILRLSKVVQPVCYHNVNNIHLNLRSVGVVTGWGYTQPGGSPSDVLKEIAIPYKDDATCISNLPNDFLERFFTYDKFCAGHYNKSISVCKGDSGGGLVFPNRRDGRYYIYGLVSVALKVTQGCNVQLSSLYTKVSLHLEWIEQITARYI